MNLVHALELDEIVLKQLGVVLDLLLVTKGVLHLVPQDLLLERVSIDRLSLVVGEDHLHLGLSGTDKLVLAWRRLLEASGELLLHARRAAHEAGLVMAKAIRSTKSSRSLL